MIVLRPGCWQREQDYAVTAYVIIGCKLKKGKAHLSSDSMDKKKKAVRS